MPTLTFKGAQDTTTLEALKLFNAYAQDEELYAYIKQTVKAMDGGNETDVNRAIEKTRDCFTTLPSVPVVWRRYGLPPFYMSSAIGGWDGVKINQNPKKILDKVERAGHWFHELTHACGFTHISNNIKTHPIIRESWPYQAGYAFEDFVTTKLEKVKLAGEL